MYTTQTHLIYIESDIATMHATQLLLTAHLRTASSCKTWPQCEAGGVSS